jgi:hypothetical protein
MQGARRWRIKPLSYRALYRSNMSARIVALAEAIVASIARVVLATILADVFAIP